MVVGMDMFCFRFVDVNDAVKIFRPRGQSKMVSAVGGRSCMSTESASMIFYGVQRHWCPSVRR